MFRSKEGISPILATLLLIVIAVAAIVVTYAWITTYMGTATEQAGFIPYKANVAFLGTSQNKNIAIDIGNSGTSNGQIVQIYVGTTASALSQATVTQTLPASISAGEIESFSLTYDWTAGNTYYFRVVPSSGAALSFQATA